MSKELTKQSDRLKQIHASLEKMRPQFKLVLGRAVTPERFVRVCLTEMRRIPKLADCNGDSLLGAFMTAAQLQLEPGINGQCWVLPYGREAKIVIGYQGLLDLSWRSAMVSSVTAECVYQGDEFDYQMGDDPFIRHKPMGKTKDPKDITHAYAVIETTTHGKIRKVMRKDELDEVRDNAPSARASSSPWKTHYAEMCKKTTLRRACKLGPSSIEMRRAIALDELAEIGKAQHLGDAIDVSYTATNGEDVDYGDEKKALPEGDTCPDCRLDWRLIKATGHKSGCGYEENAA